METSGPETAPGTKQVSPERQALLDKLAASILKKRSQLQHAKAEETQTVDRKETVTPKQAATAQEKRQATVKDTAVGKAAEEAKMHRYRQLYQLLVGIQTVDLVLLDLHVSASTLIQICCGVEAALFVWPAAETLVSLFSRIQLSILYCLLLVPLYRLFRAAMMPARFQDVNSFSGKDNQRVLDSVGPFVTRLATKIEEYQHFKKIALVIDTAIVLFVFLASQFIPNDAQGKRNELMSSNTFSGARVLALWVLWMILDLAKQGLHDALVESKDPYQTQTILKMRRDFGNLK